MNYTYKMTDKDVETATRSIKKNSAGLVLQIQKVCTSILVNWQSSGDKDTAVRRANALVEALGDGLRKNSLLKWFESNSPMIYNKESKGLAFGSTAASPVRKFQDIPVLVLPSTPWQTAKAEEEYKPITDLSVLIKALVKKATADLEKLGSNSKVKKEQLAALEAASKL
jgi:hypothetical protein